VERLWYNGTVASRRLVTVSHRRSQAQENTMNKKPSLKRMLSRGNVVYVEFLKKDGSLRKMICTRNMTKIPPCKHPVGANHDYPDYQIRVFDLIKQDWRSMDEDSVQLVTKIE
jgi:5-deoxy-D-glucuronate isomerase